MPKFKPRTLYLKLKETKLEIMQLFIGKFIKRGLKARAFKLWFHLLYLIKINFLIPQLELNLQNKPSFFLPTENLEGFSTMSSQQFAFIQMNKLTVHHSEIQITPLEQFLYTALDNVCPILLFNKKQKNRQLILLPVYAKYSRDLRLGITWLIVSARVFKVGGKTMLDRLFLELSDSALNQNTSNALSLKLQYYLLAQKNKKYIKARRYFN